MLPPLASIWDTAVLPTVIRTMVGTAVITVIVTTGTFATAVIVTAVGAILALTRIVTVILTVVIAAIVTAIGAGALLLVVIRPIIASAGVTPVALPGVAARLVRQGTLTAPMTAPAGKFTFRGYPDEYLWLDKFEVLQTRKVSAFKSNHCVVPKFAFVSVRTTIVRKVSS
jgi:hypothetical protein